MIWKMETNAGMLDQIRMALTETSPELVDLGLRIASVKATALDWGMAGGTWLSYPVTIYLTGPEKVAIESVAAERGIDLTDKGWLGFHPRDRYELREGAKFGIREMKTKTKTKTA